MMLLLSIAANYSPFLYKRDALLEIQSKNAFRVALVVPVQFDVRSVTIDSIVSLLRIVR
jgi:hypothetical protein